MIRISGLKSKKFDIPDIKIFHSWTSKKTANPLRVFLTHVFFLLEIKFVKKKKNEKREGKHVTLFSYKHTGELG